MAPDFLRSLTIALTSEGWVIIALSGEEAERRFILRRTLLDGFISFSTPPIR